MRVGVARQTAYIRVPPAPEKAAFALPALEVHPMATAKKSPSASKSSKKAGAKKKVTKKKVAKKKVTKKKVTKKKAAKKASAKKVAKKKVAKKTAAKKTSAKKVTKKKATKKKAKVGGNASGRQLVIVESPAKAKTINKYLGDDFVVHASVGHIRDLPAKAPKGVKMPVPGVDLDNNFSPTYEVLPGKAKTVNELKRLAKDASEIWFATDLDREGEAIAWHLAQELGVEPLDAKRVVFNAITKTEVQRAFAEPNAIDVAKVNAQQARRILDRIVGYQASPLLWKKVARGLSAGRVQSVAVRIIVEREREIEAFVPDEYWKVTAHLALDPGKAPKLAESWTELLAQRDEKNKPPTLKARNAWLAEHQGLKTELVSIDGKKFDVSCKAESPKDLSKQIAAVAEAVGLTDVTVENTPDPDGKGPAQVKRAVNGTLDPKARYAIKSIDTRRTTSRPPGPFITSSLQIAAANQLGFTAQRTMRAAQQLYEGIEVPGDEGQVGLITYMRTDSTNLSPEAVAEARTFVSEFGAEYLPEKPNTWSSSNKDAQEAHEAIRPTAASRRPADLEESLTPDQFRLYDLIWRRFVAGQMVPAKWDATAVLYERSDTKSGATLKATGRVLAFDGFYKVAGVPTASDEQTLPELAEGDEAAPFAINPDQKFTSPPPRYSEASLVKTLEAEGIGRPSTYASIISVIQGRRYVEQLDRRFYATDLGEVVTDKLVEAFPSLMSIGYTRSMEDELDRIEDDEGDWQEMLTRFHGPFTEALEVAHESMTHAKAETQPALYKCPKCGSQTLYRFGRNGRFLSCSTYPDCDYSAPIDRAGRPLLPERVDVAVPEDGSQMELRNGRFGPFLASINYPETNFVLNLDKKGGVKYPSIPPIETELECTKCDAPMNLRRGKRGPWLGCSRFPKCRGRMGWNTLEDEIKDSLEKQLEKHEKANPLPKIKRFSNGEEIPEGHPVAELVVPGGVAELEVHPDVKADADVGIKAAKRPLPPRPEPTATA